MATRKFISRKTKKYSRKQKGGGINPHSSKFSRRIFSRRTITAKSRGNAHEAAARARTRASTMNPVERVHFKTARSVDAIKNIINFAGLLKATGTKEITNHDGRVRKSYDPEAIKKLLIKKGHTDPNVIRYIPKLVSDKGIAVAARHIGVQGYNRQYAQKNELEIRKIHNPQQAALNVARARARAAMTSFNNTIGHSVNPNFGISSG